MMQSRFAAGVVVGVIVLTLGASAQADGLGLSLEQRLDRLVLERYPSESEPGRVVLVTVDGKPVLRKGYGLADVEKGVKVTPDMIFRIASVTKQFTAVAVLQLVQAGKVALDDSISKYVPEFDTHGKTITIEHLLTHTSGLFNVTALDGFLEQITRDRKPFEVANLIAGKPLEFEPGTRFQYSNTNYILLGMVIEKASGKSYAEYLAESIAKPGGLSDTRYSHDDALTPRHARGYERDDSGKWNPRRPMSMSQPFAAGAIESTVDDLARWMQVLVDGKIVDPKLLAKAWTPGKPQEGSSDYGYGWFIREESGERWIGHNGGIHGFQSSMIWIPEKKVFVAILQNGMGGASPDVLLRRLALEVLGRSEPKRVAMTLPVDTLKNYVGVYALAPDRKFTILLEGERLIAVAPNKSRVEIKAEAEDRFFSPDSDVQFTFTMKDGKATQMTLRRAGRDSVALREE